VVIHTGAGQVLRTVKKRNGSDTQLCRSEPLGKIDCCQIDQMDRGGSSLLKESSAVSVTCVCGKLLTDGVW
jgi:hypothetical protein